MSDHVRAELMNPKYFVQRQAEKERSRNPNGDNDIYRHLREFAERRTDIFGDTELTIGQSIEEDIKQAKKRERDRIIWDGHSASINEVIAQKISNSTSGEQSVQIKKGIAPAPAPTSTIKPASLPIMSLKPLMSKISAIPPPPPPISFISEPIPLPSFVPPLEEPPIKKPKTEEISLLSFAEFLASTSEETVRISVDVPNEPNKEKWTLNRQTIFQEMRLTDTVLQLKEKLEGMLGGMKPNRQKLTTDHGVILKDQFTFADHNLAGDLHLQLKVKERGGKK